MSERNRIVFVCLALLTALFLSPTAALGKKGAADEEDEKKKEGLPLETTRRLELTAERATWLSLDVSPDGGTIVFELLGDLYTLPIAGGKATRITEGAAFDSQPRYSPDGERIVYVSDSDGSDNVWIARADGSEPKQISKDGNAYFASPIWTPDGDYVIASRSSWGLRTFELWMYHVKGGSGIQLTKAKSGGDTDRNQRHNALGASVSPDGRYLYYARRSGGFSYNASFPMWQIARRDLQTGDEDVITQAPGSAFRPWLSPDGKRLVYGTRLETETGLRIRDLTTGEDRMLRYPVQRDEQESRFTRDLLPNYAFTPDGKAVLATWDGRIQRIDVASGESSEIRFEAQVDIGLGPRLHFPQRVETGPVRARIIQDPSQSPDGKRLAFSALTRLYTMSLPDGEPERLTSGDAREFQPAWSPDGKWIAYVTWDGREGHLWKVSASGAGKPTRLTRNAAFYASPVWAPDGRKLVLLRGSAYQRLHSPFDFGGTAEMDLIWIRSGGGDVELIAPSRGRGGPHFGDEPDRVYVYSQGGLMSMRLDGTDRRQHLKVTGAGLYFAEEPVPANDMRISPDGRWALAHVQNQLYVTVVPTAGPEAPTVNVGGASVPVKKLTSVGADYFAWADGGKTMTWAVGSTFYRQPLDSVVFDPPKPEKDEGEDDGSDKKKKKKKKDDEAEKKEEPKLYTGLPVVVERPRARPAGSVVLQGARIVTMRGDEVLDDGAVVVEGDRISFVGPGSRLRHDEDAEVVDCSGMTIVPGFIDTHAHWFEIRRGVLDASNWSFLANLAYGVTAGLDVQTSTNDMFAYQDLVDSGEIWGPRAYSTGPGVFSDNAFESKEEAAGVLERYRDHYRTRHIKSYIVGNRKQLQYVAQAAAELEMMPTTEGALDMKLELIHALDGLRGNEHSMPVVPLLEDVVQLYAQSKIGYTPTLLVTYGGPFAENYYYTKTEVHDDPKLNRFVPHNLIDMNSRRRPWFRDDEYTHPRIAAQAAKIIRAGGHVGVGSHGQLQGLGFHWELWALASGGLTPLEALRAATLHGAEMIGLGQDLGSIEPGKLADLVVLSENPLDDIHNTNSVRYVMKNGELFDGNTLDRLLPSPQKLAPLWWWEMGTGHSSAPER